MNRDELDAARDALTARGCSIGAREFEVDELELFGAPGEAETARAAVERDRAELTADEAAWHAEDDAWTAEPSHRLETLDLDVADARLAVVSAGVDQLLPGAHDPDARRLLREFGAEVRQTRSRIHHDRPRHPRHRTAVVAVQVRRTAPRARGAGRPRALARASSRAGDSGDSDEPAPANAPASSGSLLARLVRAVRRARRAVVAARGPPRAPARLERGRRPSGAQEPSETDCAPA